MNFHAIFYKIFNQIKKMIEKDSLTSQNQNLHSQLLNYNKILVKSLFYQKDSNNNLIYSVLALTKTNILIYQCNTKNQFQYSQVQYLNAPQRLHSNLTFDIIQEKKQLKNNQSTEVKFVFYESFIKIKEFYAQNYQTIGIWERLLKIYFHQCSFNKKFSQFLKLQNQEYCTFYEAISIETNTKVLIKAFSKQIIYCSNDYKNQLINKIQLLRILYEHEIKLLLGIFQTQFSIYLILESQISSLQKYLRNQNLFPITNAENLLHSLISQIMKFQTTNENINMNPIKFDEKNNRFSKFHIFQPKQNKDQDIVKVKTQESNKMDICGIEIIINILNNYLISQKLHKQITDENLIGKIDQYKPELQVKQMYKKPIKKISGQKISKFKGLKQNKQEYLVKRVF